MELYAGIDLHSDSSMVALLGEADRMISRKRLPDDLDGIVLALESTFNGCGEHFDVARADMILSCPRTCWLIIPFSMGRAIPRHELRHDDRPDTALSQSRMFT